MVLPIEENLAEKAKELYDCWSVKSFFLFFFWLSHAACGILVPRPGIEPGVVAVKAPSPNHWTTREVPNFARFVQKVDLLTEKVYLIQALYLFLLSYSFYTSILLVPENCGHFLFPVILSFLVLLFTLLSEVKNGTAKFFFLPLQETNLALGLMVLCHFNPMLWFNLLSMPQKQIKTPHIKLDQEAQKP